MNDPTQVALSLEGIKAASFRNRLGNWSGTVYDNVTGQEYDVSQENLLVWRVNDDDGNDYRAIGLKNAIRKARKELA